MWYNRGHESTSVYPTRNRRRTQPGPSRVALVRCLCPAALPDSAGFRPWRTSAGDRPATGLPQADRAHRHPQLQCLRPGSAARRLLAPPSAAHDLLGGRTRALARSAASQSTRLWPRAGHLDVGVGGPGQLRAGHHGDAGLRRKCAACSQATQDQLEARQALDYQPRSAVSTQKKARDRLIAYASQLPEWAIGFLDEVWWSRFAQPTMHAWQSAAQPVRLVEQTWQKDDPDP